MISCRHLAYTHVCEDPHVKCRRLTGVAGLNHESRSLVGLYSFLQRDFHWECVRSFLDAERFITRSHSLFRQPYRAASSVSRNFGSLSSFSIGIGALLRGDNLFASLANNPLILLQSETRQVALIGGDSSRYSRSKQQQPVKPKLKAFMSAAAAIFFMLLVAKSLNLALEKDRPLLITVLLISGFVCFVCAQYAVYFTLRQLFG